MNEHFEIDEEALEAAREEFLRPSGQAVGHSFVYACTIDEIPKHGKRGKIIVCEYDEIALFSMRGSIYAISNICPHQMSPLMADGIVDLDAITVACPMHGWTYRITDGKSVVGGGSIASYQVRIDGNEVWVEEPLEREQPIVTIDPDYY